MLSKADNELMCRVEGDQPMGIFLRRFWMPACLLDEIPSPGEGPVRVNLVGERLVAWRNAEGRVGLMSEASPSRYRSCSRAMKVTDCAAFITAGRLMSPTCM